MPTASFFRQVSLPAELASFFRIFYIITMTTKELPAQEPHTFLVSQLTAKQGMLACPSPLAEWAMKWMNK